MPKAQVVDVELLTLCYVRIRIIPNIYCRGFDGAIVAGTMILSVAIKT